MQPDRRPLTELVFLHRGPLVLRAVAVVIAAVAAGVVGVAIARLETSLAVQLASGVALSGPQTLLAQGSDPRTAWIGWAAAVCFGAAALSLRRGPLEPAAGRGEVQRLSADVLRRGLRREYAWVRALLVLVALVTAVDAARAGALLGEARGDALWTLVEVLGFAVATIVVAAWAWWFGGDLRRVGALG